MARKLRCWRKTGLKTWKGKDGNEITIHDQCMYTREKKGWGYKVKDRPRDDKCFPTKKQALEFANSYMRKHDKC